MRIFFIFLFLILGTTSCYTIKLENKISGEMRHASRIPALDYDTNINNNLWPKSKLLTFEKLKDIAATKKTVDAAIEEIAKNYEDYTKIHNLMYESRSLQEASFKEPRAVVFGPEAKFIFTFNGGNHQRGGYSIETMEFDETLNEFNFREIIFKSENKNGVSPYEDEGISIENENIIVSKAKSFITAGKTLKSRVTKLI